METAINEFEDIIKVFNENTPNETIKKIKEILGYIEAFEEQKNENIEFIVGTRGTNCLQEMKYTVR